MQTSPDLARYVRDALQEGRSGSQIRSALEAAGWTSTETDAALAGWMATADSGPVPRPVRSNAARDALFYALLFVVFGMVAGNVLALLFGQINYWIPEPGDWRRYASANGMRWSMAALIVFAPTFFFIDRSDRRATQADPARTHGTARRWLSALAMLIAVTTLLGDALYLIYTWLDGQLTARFLAKSATVAGIAVIVLAYFREDRTMPFLRVPLPASGLLMALAALSLGLSLWTIGGPAQGQVERRDSLRIKDMRTLSHDIANCTTIDRDNLPEQLDPMDCARNPARLTGFAQEVTYTRIAKTEFELCVGLEFPPRARDYGLRVDANTACISRMAR